MRILSLTLLLGILLTIQACESNPSASKTRPEDGPAHSCEGDGRSPGRSSQDDATASRAAFLAAYPVFMHPRCMNCHPSGDQPLQGDDSHIHTQNIQRGPDGKGLFALKCSNCHQAQNVPGNNMPPGHPEWHLPPANRKMVFQGKSPAELARAFKDPTQTGKTLEQMIDHVTNDSLVGVGWNPGDGRPVPPLSRAEFAAKFKEWVDKGAAIPE